MHLGWNIFNFDEKTAKLALSIIKDGIEEIDLSHYLPFTNQGIKIIAKISKFSNPVNNFIFYKNCDQHV